MSSTSIVRGAAAGRSDQKKINCTLRGLHFIGLSSSFNFQFSAHFLFSSSGISLILFTCFCLQIYVYIYLVKCSNIGDFARFVFYKYFIYLIGTICVVCIIVHCYICICSYHLICLSVFLFDLSVRCVCVLFCLCLWL